jgi:hypothetical protein
MLGTIMSKVPNACVSNEWLTIDKLLTIWAEALQTRVAPLQHSAVRKRVVRGPLWMQSTTAKNTRLIDASRPVAACAKPRIEEMTCKVTTKCQRSSVNGHTPHLQYTLAASDFLHYVCPSKTARPTISSFIVVVFLTFVGRKITNVLHWSMPAPSCHHWRQLTVNVKGCPHENNPCDRT